MSAAAAHSASALARVEAALEAAGSRRGRPGQWTCPAHDDRTPSLSVRNGDGRVLVRCFAGCEFAAIVDALGLARGDFFDEPRARNADRREVAAYRYTDEHGELLFETVRYVPKGFNQRRPDGCGGWIYRLGDTRRVLYRLPEVLSAVAAGDTIYIAEGEKDVEALRAADCVATCNAMGAGKWRAEYAEALVGAHVVIVADRDEPGRAHALEVAASLESRAASVRIVEPASGKDASDHLAAGHSVDAFVAMAETGEPTLLDSLAFTGPRLLELLDRPEPAPIHPGLSVPGHLRVLVAPSFSGKTSLALWCAAARAKGVAPWAGAPQLAPGRVLLVSIDEAPEQVVRRLRWLSHFHPAGPVASYAENLLVIGPDRDTDPEALEALRFTDDGLALLEQWVVESQVAEVCIDAYADMIPIGETENSNEEGTRIGGALERIAVRTGVAVTLLHHAGKPRADRGDGPTDLRTLGRGASALAAKARTITSIEEMPGFPHLRRIRTVTNLGRAPRDLMLQVCSADAESPGLDFFRAYDPLAAYRPADYIGADEEISTNVLAWRLAGSEPEPGKTPPGEAKKLAAELRHAWLEEGVVEVMPGPRGAKLLRLSGGCAA